MLLKVSQEGQKATSSFRTVNSIKEFQKFETTAKSAINGVSTAYKGLNQVQQAQLKSYKDQQRAALNLAAAEKQEAVETEKLKLKRSELLKLSKQQAKEELGLVSAYDKVVAKMNAAGKTVQNLNAKRLSGQKLSDKEQAELRQSTAQFNKYQRAVTVADTSIKRFQRNVGNYPKQIASIANGLKQLIPIVGVVGALKLGFDFAKESRQLAIEAKGVEFAFERLGLVGVDALERIKKSTRGLLSDLDIKKALVDFDNFNISLEETDVLFEFLAVRAAQTGKSIDELQSSLVEGLSKESKLRIDNLGISTSDLNNELKKTPNFVKAVANIAKREVKEAGSILDNAGNAQEKWNASLNNFKLSIGSGFIAKAANSMYEFGTSVLEAISPTKNLTNAIKDEQVSLNTLVASIINTNEENEDRERLINELSDQYPFFLKFIDDEKVGNESLKKALTDVNGLYIKRLALQRLTDRVDLAGKINNQADKTADLAKVESDYQKVLTSTNLFINKNTLDTDLNGKSVLRQNEILKKSINNEIVRLSQLRGQNKASSSQLRNLAKLEKRLQVLSDATKVFNNASSKFGFAKSSVEDAKAEIKKIEEALGLTSEQIKDLFDGDENAVFITVKLNDKEAKAQADKLNKEIFELEKSRLERQIKLADEAQKNESANMTERLEANQIFQQKTQALIKLTSDYEISNAEGRKNVIVKIQEETENEKTDALKKGLEKRNEIIVSDFEKRVEDLKKLQEKDDLNLDNDELDLEKKLIEQGKSVKEIERETTKFRREERKKQLKDQIEFTIKELEILAITSNQKEQIARKIYELRKELHKLTLDNMREEEELAEETEKERLDRLREYEDAVRSAFEGIGEALGISSDNLATIFLGIENGFKDAGDAAKSFGQLATEVLNSVSEAQSQRIEARLEGLETEKETALKFAGDSAAAKEEIEKQYDAKRRALKRKQFQTEKDAQVIASIINTASAVIEALPNIPLSIAVGVIGAAQTSIIASQKVPEFFVGTEDTGKGGNVDNRGGFNAILHPNERVITKSQNKKMHGYSNEKVSNIINEYHTNTGFMAELKALTDMNNIMFDSSLINIPEMPDVNVNGLDTNAMRGMFKNLEKTIKNKSSIELVRDERGYNTYLKHQSARTQLLNNKINIRS